LTSKMAGILARRCFSTSARRFGGVGADHATHVANAKKWKMLTFFGAIPVVVLVGIYVYLDVSAEHGHHERKPYVPYEYLRIRTKRFPWGDNSLFHNPAVQVGPNGVFEDEE